jgi:hypothetical protein
MKCGLAGDRHPDGARASTPDLAAQFRQQSSCRVASHAAAVGRTIRKAGRSACVGHKTPPGRRSRLEVGWLT